MYVHYVSSILAILCGHISVGEYNFCIKNWQQSPRNVSLIKFHFRKSKTGDVRKGGATVLKVGWDLDPRTPLPRKVGGHDPPAPMGAPPLDIRRIVVWLNVTCPICINFHELQ